MYLKNFKPNKKLTVFSVVLGLVVSIITPNFDFDIRMMREGMIWGLAIGIFWSLVRFYLHGEEGVVKSQKELTASTFYIAMFLVGYFAGWLLLKLLTWL